MVRTDQMWRYTGTIKLPHYHGDGNYTTLTNETLTEVNPSPVQGWNFTLECGCTLQACFDGMEWDVEVIWHEDVVNWGK